MDTLESEDYPIDALDFSVNSLKNLNIHAHEFSINYFRKKIIIKYFRKTTKDYRVHAEGCGNPRASRGRASDAVGPVSVEARAF